MIAGFEDGNPFGQGADSLYGVQVALRFDFGDGGHKGFELSIVDLAVSVEALVNLFLQADKLFILGAEAKLGLLLLLATVTSVRAGRGRQLNPESLSVRSALRSRSRMRL